MININQRQFDFNAKKYVLTSPANRAVFGAKLFGEKKQVRSIMFNNDIRSRNGLRLRKEMLMDGMEYMRLTFQDNQMNRKDKRKGMESDEIECNMYVKELSYWPKKKVEEWKKI